MNNETSLKDFAISYTEVSKTETDWSDDLSTPKGTLEGTRISTATVADWNGGDVLKIDTRVLTVKSIPGLKYQVLASDSLDPTSFTPAGQAQEATGTRRELTVTPSKNKGFYKIQVSR